MECGCYSFCCTGTSGSGSDVVGTAIPEDAAVLSGFSSRTGKITFTLTGSSGHVVETLTDIVKGNGTYVTNGAVVATLVGTYQWSAVYSGDTHNSSAHDQGGTAEQDVVWRPVRRCTRGPGSRAAANAAAAAAL